MESSNVRKDTVPGTDVHDHRFKIYKIQFCRFALAGRCRRGSFCTFAHSLSDLRVRPLMKKTKICAAWRRKACPFDDRTCKFAHGMSDLQKGKPALCELYRAGKCNKGSQCRFAHSVDEISTDYAPHTPDALQQALPKNLPGSPASFEKLLLAESPPRHPHHPSKNHASNSSSHNNSSSSNRSGGERDRLGNATPTSSSCGARPHVSCCSSSSSSSHNIKTTRSSPHRNSNGTPRRHPLMHTKKARGSTPITPEGSGAGGFSSSSSLPTSSGGLPCAGCRGGASPPVPSHLGEERREDRGILSGRDLPHSYPSLKHTLPKEGGRGKSIPVSVSSSPTSTRHAKKPSPSLSSSSRGGGNAISPSSSSSSSGTPSGLSIGDYRGRRGEESHRRREGSCCCCYESFSSPCSSTSRSFPPLLTVERRILTTASAACGVVIPEGEGMCSRGDEEERRRRRACSSLGSSPVSCFSSFSPLSSSSPSASSSSSTSRRHLPPSGRITGEAEEGEPHPPSSSCYSGHQHPISLIPSIAKPHRLSPSPSSSSHMTPLITTTTTTTTSSSLSSSSLPPPSFCSSLLPHEGGDVASYALCTSRSPHHPGPITTSTTATLSSAVESRDDDGHMEGEGEGAHTQKSPKLFPSSSLLRERENPWREGESHHSPALSPTSFNFSPSVSLQHDKTPPTKEGRERGGDREEEKERDQPPHLQNTRHQHGSSSNPPLRCILGGSLLVRSRRSGAKGGGSHSQTKTTSQQRSSACRLVVEESPRDLSKLASSSSSPPPGEEGGTQHSRHESISSRGPCWQGEGGDQQQGERGVVDLPRRRETVISSSSSLSPSLSDPDRLSTSIKEERAEQSPPPLLGFLGPLPQHLPNSSSSSSQGKLCDSSQERHPHTHLCLSGDTNGEILPSSWKTTSYNGLYSQHVSCSSHSSSPPAPFLPSSPYHPHPSYPHLMSPPTSASPYCSTFTPSLSVPSDPSRCSLLYRNQPMITPPLSALSEAPGVKGEMAGASPECPSLLSLHGTSTSFETASSHVPPLFSSSSPTPDKDPHPSYSPPHPHPSVLATFPSSSDPISMNTDVEQNAETLRRESKERQEDPSSSSLSQADPSLSIHHTSSSSSCLSPSLPSLLHTSPRHSSSSGVQPSLRDSHSSPLVSDKNEVVSISPPSSSSSSSASSSSSSPSGDPSSCEGEVTARGIVRDQGDEAGGVYTPNSPRFSREKGSPRSPSRTTGKRRSTAVLGSSRQEATSLENRSEREDKKISHQSHPDTRQERGGSCREENLYRKRERSVERRETEKAISTPLSTSVQEEHLKCTYTSSSTTPTPPFYTIGEKSSLSDRGEEKENRHGLSTQRDEEKRTDTIHIQGDEKGDENTPQEKRSSTFPSPISVEGGLLGGEHHHFPRPTLSHETSSSSPLIPKTTAEVSGRTPQLGEGHEREITSSSSSSSASSFSCSHRAPQHLPRSPLMYFGSEGHCLSSSSSLREGSGREGGESSSLHHSHPSSFSFSTASSSSFSSTSSSSLSLLPSVPPTSDNNPRGKTGETCVVSTSTRHSHSGHHSRQEKRSSQEEGEENDRTGSMFVMQQKPPPVQMPLCSAPLLPFPFLPPPYKPSSIPPHSHYPHPHHTRFLPLSTSSPSGEPELTSDKTQQQQQDERNLPSSSSSSCSPLSSSSFSPQMPSTGDRPASSSPPPTSASYCYCPPHGTEAVFNASSSLSASSSSHQSKQGDSSSEPRVSAAVSDPSLLSLGRAASTGDEVACCHNSCHTTTAITPSPQYNPHGAPHPPRQPVCLETGASMVLSTSRASPHSETGKKQSRLGLSPNRGPPPSSSSSLLSCSSSPSPHRHHVGLLLHQEKPSTGIGGGGGTSTKGNRKKLSGGSHTKKRGSSSSSLSSSTLPAGRLVSFMPSPSASSTTTRKGTPPEIDTGRQDLPGGREVGGIVTGSIPATTSLTRTPGDTGKKKEERRRGVGEEKRSCKPGGYIKERGPHSHRHNSSPSNCPVESILKEARGLGIPKGDGGGGHPSSGDAEGLLSSRNLLLSSCQASLALSRATGGPFQSEEKGGPVRNLRDSSSSSLPPLPDNEHHHNDKRNHLVDGQPQHSPYQPLQALKAPFHEDGSILSSSSSFSSPFYHSLYSSASASLSFYFPGNDLLHTHPHPPSGCAPAVPLLATPSFPFADPRNSTIGGVGAELQHHHHHSSSFSSSYLPPLPPPSSPFSSQAWYCSSSPSSSSYPCTMAPPPPPPPGAFPLLSAQSVNSPHSLHTVESTIQSATPTQHQNSTERAHIVDDSRGGGGGSLIYMNVSDQRGEVPSPSSSSHISLPCEPHTTRGYPSYHDSHRRSYTLLQQSEESGTASHTLSLPTATTPIQTTRDLLSPSSSFLSLPTQGISSNASPDALNPIISSSSSSSFPLPQPSSSFSSSLGPYLLTPLFSHPPQQASPPCISTTSSQPPSSSSSTALLPFLASSPPPPPTTGCHSSGGSNSIAFLGTSALQAHANQSSYLLPSSTLLGAPPLHTQPPLHPHSHPQHAFFYLPSPLPSSSSSSEESRDFFLGSDQESLSIPSSASSSSEPSAYPLHPLSYSFSCTDPHYPLLPMPSTTIVTSSLPHPYQSPSSSSLPLASSFAPTDREGHLTTTPSAEETEEAYMRSTMIMGVLSSSGTGLQGEKDQEILSSSAAIQKSPSQTMLANGEEERGEEQERKEQEEEEEDRLLEKPSSSASSLPLTPRPRPPQPPSDLPTLLEGTSLSNKEEEDGERKGEGVERNVKRREEKEEEKDVQEEEENKDRMQGRKRNDHGEETKGTESASSIMSRSHTDGVSSVSGDKSSADSSLDADKTRKSSSGRKRSIEKKRRRTKRSCLHRSTSESKDLSNKGKDKTKEDEEEEEKDEKHKPTGASTTSETEEGGAVASSQCFLSPVDKKKKKISNTNGQVEEEKEEDVEKEGDFGPEKREDLSASQKDGSPLVVSTGTLPEKKHCTPENERRREVGLLSGTRELDIDEKKKTKKKEKSIEGDQERQEEQEEEAEDPHDTLEEKKTSVWRENEKEQEEEEKDMLGKSLFETNQDISHLIKTAPPCPPVILPLAATSTPSGLSYTYLEMIEALRVSHQPHDVSDLLISLAPLHYED